MQKIYSLQESRRNARKMSKISEMKLRITEKVIRAFKRPERTDHISYPLGHHFQNEKFVFNWKKNGFKKTSGRRSIFLGVFIAWIASNNDDSKKDTSYLDGDPSGSEQEKYCRKRHPKWRSTICRTAIGQHERSRYSHAHNGWLLTWICLLFHTRRKKEKRHVAAPNRNKNHKINEK